MLHGTQKGIVFIVASLVNQRQYAGVYSDVDAHDTMFTGAIGDEINIYDFDRSENISGELKPEGYSLHDYSCGSQLSLTVEGNTFKGMDDRSGKNFKGSVDGNRVMLFDAEHAQRRTFTLRVDRLNHNRRR